MMAHQNQSRKMPPLTAEAEKAVQSERMSEAELGGMLDHSSAAGGADGTLAALSPPQ